MANSAKAVAILGGQQHEVAELAWQYGRHLGLAFQVSSCHTCMPCKTLLRCNLRRVPQLMHGI